MGWLLVEWDGEGDKAKLEDATDLLWDLLETAGRDLSVSLDVSGSADDEAIARAHQVMALHPINTGWVAYPVSQGDEGLWRSEDDGATWVKI